MQLAKRWLLWFGIVVPAALRRVNEPLGSRNAAYTPGEAARLAEQSRLSGWRVTRGPLWLTYRRDGCVGIRFWSLTEVREIDNVARLRYTVSDKAGQTRAP